MAEPDVVDVALCAWGMSGREFHAPLIDAEPRMRLHTILRRSGPDGSEPPGVRIVDDFAAILADPDVRLVVVDTPNRLHHQMASAALAAGKDVVVEKPMTVTLAEARSLTAQAREAGRMLAVFHNRRLDAEHLTLARHLAAGDLGRPIEVEWRWDRYRPHVTAKRWKEDDLPGAGTWFDFGSHLVDGMRELFGAPLSVAADMASLRRAEGATDFFDVRFRYPDLRVRLRSSTFVREPGPVVVAHGDRGSLVISGGRGGTAVAEPRALLHTMRADGTVVRETVPLEAARHHEFYRDVAAAMIDRRPSSFGPEGALETLRLVLSAVEAAKRPAFDCRAFPGD